MTTGSHVHRYPQWALTSHGTPILCVSSYPLGGPTKSNPILFLGGVHGDEPEGVELAQQTLAWLESLGPAQAAILTPWLVIPCINPDGYKAGNRTNGNGVDLNRNFPERNWRPEFSKDRYNPGPKPGSENETQALVHLIESEKPRLIVHCHSWNPCVVYTGSQGRPIAERFAQVSGYNPQETIGYDCPGSLGDYGWHEKNIPVICIEEQEGAALPTIWPRFQSAVQWLFQACPIQACPIE